MLEAARRTAKGKRTSEEFGSCVPSPASVDPRGPRTGTAARQLTENLWHCIHCRELNGIVSTKQKSAPRGAPLVPYVVNSLVFVFFVIVFVLIFVRIDIQVTALLASKRDAKRQMQIDPGINHLIVVLEDQL